MVRNAHRVPPVSILRAGILQSHPSSMVNPDKRRRIRQLGCAWFVAYSSRTPKNSVADEWTVT
jgi:hypothetical protein